MNTPDEANLPLGQVPKAHETPSQTAPTPGDDLSARITLRLPEGLKVQIEAVANSEGVSTNAWIVRALSRALEPRRDSSDERIRAWIAWPRKSGRPGAGWLHDLIET